MDTVLGMFEKIFEHSQEITDKFDIYLSSNYTKSIPTMYKNNIRIIYDEDYKKLEAIARLADEQQKKIDELEAKIRNMPNGYDYYYPLGGGVL